MIVSAALLSFRLASTERRWILQKKKPYKQITMLRRILLKMLTIFTYFGILNNLSQLSMLSHFIKIQRLTWFLVPAYEWRFRNCTYVPVRDSKPSNSSIQYYHSINWSVYSRLVMQGSTNWGSSPQSQDKNEFKSSTLHNIWSAIEGLTPSW